MDKATLATILWIAAALVFVLYMLRRRSRKRRAL
jgi:hypothetical protein